MAVASVPRWTPDPVPVLPSCTTIEFIVIPGFFAQEGIVIEYVLHSMRAQFADGPALPGLSAGELAGSAPVPPELQPRQRSGTLIIDRYPNAKRDTPFSIKRALCLRSLPGSTPGIATITVTVSDVKTGGAPTDVFVQSQTIAL